MKNTLLTLCLLAATFSYCYSQLSPSAMAYEPGAGQPFGKLNPEAPAQVADFDPMIGLCDCKSLGRNPDGTWKDTTNMVWSFKYIMNGTAVQDEVWRDGNYAGSMRQFHKDSVQWAVTYYSYPSVAYNPSVWWGNKQENGDIILKKEQAAPNGMAGFSSLTFYDIKEDGFNWKGEWIKDDGTIKYPFWLIWCKKRRE